MTSVSGGGRVEFRFFRPAASSVSVAGNFNDWEEDKMSMEPAGDGWWVAATKLNAGEYRFRYVADGKWYTDFAAYGVEPGKYGWDSVLVVPKEQREAARERAMAAERRRVS
jgi:1,4-alpha-glucan branching enzyme